MRVLVTPDYRTLSRQAAEIIADAVRFEPRLTLGLPTGSTPLGMYEELVRKHSGENLDFSRVKTFNLDEYIAFNEPGSSFASRTRMVDLARETRANAGRYFVSEDEVPRRAITVGIGTILESRRILLLASGSGKSDAVARALQGPVSEDMPASALHGHSDVTAILDAAAAPCRDEC